MNKLNGSEKQVAWAEEIRTRFLEGPKNQEGVQLSKAVFVEAKEMLVNYTNKQNASSDQKKQAIDNINNTFAKAEKIESSKSWIENRVLFEKTARNIELSRSQAMQIFQALYQA